MQKSRFRVLYVGVPFWFADPSDAVNHPRSNTGGVQSAGADQRRNPCAGRTDAAGTAGPSSSPSAGTLQRKGKANDRPQPAAAVGRRWDDVTPKPFSYTHHQPMPPPAPIPQVRRRPDDSSELNGAAIKEKLMMSNTYIPESCV